MPTLIKKSPTRPSANTIRVLQSGALKRIPWLVHGFSTRSGGHSLVYGGRSLNLSFTKQDSRDAVEKNRRAFLLALGANNGDRPWPLIALKQIHSDIIHVIRSHDSGQLAGDGLITNLPGVALAVQTADCFPILLVDVRNKAAGAFHAGWRGTVNRIVEKGLGRMRHEYGSLPQDIYAAIGPGIQKCCYEVGAELKDQFESQFDYGQHLFHEVHSIDPVREKYPLLFMTMRPPGHGDTGPRLHLDLQEANRRQLLAAGVPDNQITVLEHCTSCNTRKFFSHRANKGVTGRMMAVVGIQ